MYGFFTRPAFDQTGAVTGREVDGDGGVVVVRLVANADDRAHYEAKGFEYLGWAPAPGTSTPIAEAEARERVMGEARRRGVHSRGWATTMTPAEARALEVERADPEMAEKGARERAAEIARARATEERWSDPNRANLDRAAPAAARTLQTADRPEERPGSEPGGPAERALADQGDRAAVRAVTTENPGGVAHEVIAERAATRLMDDQARERQAVHRDADRARARAHARSQDKADKPDAAHPAPDKADKPAADKKD